MPNWPNAPSRNFSGNGSYMVTASTYGKLKLFDSAEKLDLLHDMLLAHLEEFGWESKAWAVFPNHYHFVAFIASPELNLMRMLSKLHTLSATALNKMDNTSGRKVWYRSWPTKLTYERSYFARIAYVQNNPVKHGVVKVAKDYKWCSAGWFETRTDRVLYETVARFKYDNVNVEDDY
jgi:putative transposase